MSKALDFHSKGYNCAQSVTCAYCEKFGISEKDGFRIAEGFGFGMGCMGTCGAVTGMVLLAGMKYSDGNLEHPASKKTTYAASKQMIEEFTKKNNSTICRVIKGVDTGVVLRSCDGCISDAADIVEKILL